MPSLPLSNRILITFTYLTFIYGHIMQFHHVQHVYYWLKYVPSETKFESYILEFKLLN